jgi:hypothetical protein
MPDYEENELISLCPQAESKTQVEETRQPVACSLPGGPRGFVPIRDVVGVQEASNLDRELSVLTTIVKSLSQTDHESRIRIIQYVVSRFNKHNGTI